MSDKRDISTVSSALILCLLLSACAGNTVKNDHHDEDDILTEATTTKIKASKIPKAGPLIKVAYQQSSASSPLFKTVQPLSYP